VAAAASLADFIGLGSQELPYVAFGPIQVIGLATGVTISLIGLLFYWPREPKSEDSKKSWRIPSLRRLFSRKRNEEQETIAEETPAA
jgi:hypothetical protein